MAALSIECSVCIIIKMCFKSLLIKGGDYIHARVHNLFSGGGGVVPREFLFSRGEGGMHIFGNVKFKKFEFFRGNVPPPPHYSRSAHYIRVCLHKMYTNYRSQDHNIYMYNEQSVALLIVCILKFTLYHNVFKSCDFY